MKKVFLFPVLLALLAVIFQSCLEDQCKESRTFIKYEPVILTKEQMQANIKTLSPQDLVAPGKLYFYQNYILVAEIGGGIHFINNEDPSNPQLEAFLDMTGNRDMAIKNNILYVDNFVDLLAIDITDLLNPTVVDVEENVFEYYYPQVEGGYVVDYVPTEETVTYDCDAPYYNDDIFFLEGDIWVNTDFNVRPGGSRFEAISNFASSGQTGTGGSMARFATYQGKYLYTIDDSKLNVFDITDARDLSHVTDIQVGWGIETLFPYKDKLFIGANNGMYIFDNSNPLAPSMISQFLHVQSCDPVVVEGNTAYVTLRGGSPCGGFTNQLDIIDVSDFANPALLASHPMDHPYGLAVRDQVLYICDGDSGLKVMGVEDPLDLEALDHVKGLDTYDVISLPGDLLLLIGGDGFYQFDATDKKDLKELSHIPVKGR